MEYRITASESSVEDFDKLIIKIQKEHKENTEGVYELYDSLYMNGYCTSSKKSRIYYVAYTLAVESVDFVVESV